MATSKGASKGGGYYKDDGPGENLPANIDDIPDAQPKEEPLHKFANNPYTVFGQQYVPVTNFKPYKARGIASWYGKKFHGQKTSSGEPYDMYGMTAAHPTLPIPSYVKVTNPSTHKSVVVRVNDRGPFHSDRLMDLSYTAAYKLGIVQKGSGLVEVESINPAEPKPVVVAALAAQEPIKYTTEPVDPVEPEPSDMPLIEQSGIFLQLASFGTQINAQNFSEKIKAQLGNLSEALHIFPKNGLFKVHLGPYHNQSEATKVAENVRRTLDIKPFMVIR
ncbi:septal ring lytic transglycosylase RlpA family protein [Sulfurirhabdus autotrophica]|nr:septal ring lytic transglycosylase RlpA family protein [Sulfurirhabdus autotrophica]